jgi:hypothetical protein
MPGGGRIVEHASWPNAGEFGPALRAAVAGAADLLSALGAPLDVFLNDDSYWTLVPAPCGNTGLEDIKSSRSGSLTVNITY